tara:strand:+ start:3402 stop:4616 length:1215 start_codon:yes stop_codon:yes gene_type:complete
MNNYKDFLNSSIINDAVLEFDDIGKKEFIEKYGFEDEELFIEQDNYKYPLIPLVASKLEEDILREFLEEPQEEIISFFKTLNIDVIKSSESQKKPGKHGQKWTTDDRKYLDELWNENYLIEDIADVLERSHFSIVCQLVFRKQVNLSKILSQTSNDENIQRAVDFYVSERPQLVDVENDYVVASREKIKEAKSQVSEDKKTDKAVIRNFSNNLQRMVYEILGYPEEDLSGREIRNLLVFVKAIANLFPSEERDVFFTVNPQNGGEQKTFQEAALELDISEYKTKQLYGYALKKLQLLLPEADTELKNNTWIQVDSHTKFQMFFNNTAFTVPQVLIDPMEFPPNLSTIEDLKLPESIQNKLKNKGIFTVSQLEGKRYPDLRFGYDLDEQTSQEVVVAVQYYLKKN